MLGLAARAEGVRPEATSPRAPHHAAVFPHRPEAETSGLLMPSPLSLRIGRTLHIKGLDIRILDADALTREVLAAKGVTLGPARPLPAPPAPGPLARDPSRATEDRAASIAARMREAEKPKDPLEPVPLLHRSEYVLGFFCMWDNTRKPFGDRHLLRLRYYLGDKTAELHEILSDGNASPFVKRAHLFRDDTDHDVENSDSKGGTGAAAGQPSVARARAPVGQLALSAGAGAAGALAMLSPGSLTTPPPHTSLTHDQAVQRRKLFHHGNVDDDSDLPTNPTYGPPGSVPGVGGRRGRSPSKRAAESAEGHADAPVQTQAAGSPQPSRPSTPPPRRSMSPENLRSTLSPGPIPPKSLPQSRDPMGAGPLGRSPDRTGLITPLDLLPGSTVVIHGRRLAFFELDPFTREYMKQIEDVPEERLRAARAPPPSWAEPRNAATWRPAPPPRQPGMRRSSSDDGPPPLPGIRYEASILAQQSAQAAHRERLQEQLALATEQARGGVDAATQPYVIYSKRVGHKALANIPGGIPGVVAPPSPPTASAPRRRRRHGVGRVDGPPLRFSARLEHPVDAREASREFLVTVYPADDTLSVFERSDAVPGIAGGPCVGRARVVPDGGRAALTSEDVFLGYVMRIRSAAWVLVDADDYTLAELRKRDARLADERDDSQTEDADASKGRRSPGAQGAFAGFNVPRGAGESSSARPLNAAAPLSASSAASAPAPGSAALARARRNAGVTSANFLGTPVSTTHADFTPTGFLSIPPTISLRSKARKGPSFLPTLTSSAEAQVEVCAHTAEAAPAPERLSTREHARADAALRTLRAALLASPTRLAAFRKMLDAAAERRAKLPAQPQEGPRRRSLHAPDRPLREVAPDPPIPLPAIDRSAFVGAAWVVGLDIDPEDAVWAFVGICAEPSGDVPDSISHVHLHRIVAALKKL